MSIVDTEEIEELKRTSIYFKDLIDEISIKKDNHLKKQKIYWKEHE